MPTKGQGSWIVCPPTPVHHGARHWEVELSFSAQLVPCICSVSLSGERKISSGVWSHRIHVRAEGDGTESLVPSAEAKSNAPGLALG